MVFSQIIRSTLFWTALISLLWVSLVLLTVFLNASRSAFFNSVFRWSSSFFSSITLDSTSDDVKLFDLRPSFRLLSNVSWTILIFLSMLSLKVLKSSISELIFLDFSSFALIMLIRFTFSLLIFASKSCFSDSFIFFIVCNSILFSLEIFWNSLIFDDSVSTLESCSVIFLKLDILPSLFTFKAATSELSLLNLSLFSATNWLASDLRFSTSVFRESNFFETSVCSVVALDLDTSLVLDSSFLVIVVSSLSTFEFISSLRLEIDSFAIFNFSTNSVWLSTKLPLRSRILSNSSLCCKLP